VSRHRRVIHFFKAEQESTHNLYLTSTCSGRQTPIKKKEGWEHRHRRESAEDVSETNSGKEVQRQRERVPGRRSAVTSRSRPPNRTSRPAELS